MVKFNALGQMTVRRRLVLLTGMSMLVSAAVAGVGYQTNLMGQDINQRKFQLSSMVSNQGEADMMHDALRGDALLALQLALDHKEAMNASIAGSAVAAPSARAQERPQTAEDQASVTEALKEHSQTLAEMMDRNRKIAVELGIETIQKALVDIGPSLDAYGAAASRLVSTAFDDLAAAKAMRTEFQTAFLELEKRMEQLSELIGAHLEAAVAESHQVAERANWLFGGVCLVGALVIGLWSLATLRAILGPLSAMAGVMERLAAGDQQAVIPALDRQDEIGAMARSLTSIRETGVRAVRAQSALENVAANVMMADADGKILFMNKAVSAMLKAAEGDIRKELPRFDAGDLIGRSFDEFHKNPSHQRNLLATLNGTYRASIKVGGRNFNLIANPVLNAGGERLGTVVEWADVTQELAVQEEVAELVNAVAGGDLSTRIAMEGKSGFMKTLAEGMNKVADTVNKSVREIASMMSSMASGDLSKRISGDYRGEFLKLKEDANKTAEKLSEIVGQTVDGMANIKASTTEIATGATDLSSRTEEQVASLEEIAASIRQLNTTVQQSAENAGQASQLALAARTAAESGGEVAGSAVKAMAEIEQSSQKISDIVGMIDEIAFQTNLLALNAAVEAARAGEAGRGFAVVAGEVRALAQRSSQASKEIKALIMNSNLQVKQGVDLVNKAGATLGEIVTSVKRVSDIVAEIAAANKEQSASVGEVQEAIGQIEQATQQNAALVEETTAALGSADNQVQGVTEVIAFFQGGTPEGARPAPAVSAKGAKAVQAKLASRVAAPAAHPVHTSGAKKLAATGTDDGWEEF